MTRLNMIPHFIAAFALIVMSQSSASAQLMARPTAPAPAPAPIAAPPHPVHPHPGAINIVPQRTHVRGGNGSVYGYSGGYFPYYSAYDYGYDYYNSPSPGVYYDFDTPAPYSPPRNFATLPPLPNDHPDTARLLLQVPVGAEIWLQGKKHDVGPNHIFESPDLKPDETFTFDVRVTWKQNGKLVEEKRTLTMKAGDYQNLQYLGVATPKPEIVKIEK